MTSIEEQLRSHLLAEGRALDAPVLSLAGIERAGRRRRRRRRAALSAPPTLLAAVAMAFAATRSEEHRGEIVTAPGDVAPRPPDTTIAPTTTVPSPAPSTADVGEATLVPLPGSDDPATADEGNPATDLVVAYEGGFLLLRPVQPVDSQPSFFEVDDPMMVVSRVPEPLERIDLYRSPDGEHWSPGGSLEVPAGVHRIDRAVVDPDGTVIVTGSRALGTPGDPALSDVDPVIAATSDLSTWQWILRPAAPPPTQLPYSSSSYIETLATGPRGTIAVVSVNQHVDFHLIASLRTGTDPREAGLINAVVGDDGVTFIPPSQIDDNGDLQLPRPDDTLVLSWDDLGITPDDVRERAWTHRDLITIGSDGAIVNDVALLSGAQDGTATGVAAVDEGFVVVGREQVLVAPDGASFEERELPVAGDILGVVGVGDEVVLVIDRGSATVAARGNPWTGEWSVVDLPIDPAVTASLADFTASGEAVALAVRVGPSPVGGTLSAESGDYRLSVDSETLLFSLTRVADGSVVWDGLDLVQISGPEMMRIDEAGGTIVLRDPFTGDDVVTFGYEAVMRIIRGVAAGEPPHVEIVWSPGTDRWTAIDQLGELALTVGSSMALTTNHLAVVDPNTPAPRVLTRWVLP